MTGERWEWFRVASHLKIPVSELKFRITYSEFFDWLTFLQRREVEREMLLDGYLAQIAMEVCKSRVVNPEKIKLKDFILEMKAPEVTAPEMSQEQKDKATISKKAWKAALNLKNKPRQKRKK